MDTGLSSTSDNLQQGLEALLVEVNGLANRLKSSNAGETIPGASRSVLHVLQRHGPQTVPQIARARFSSRQNIQILVNRLQKEGLLEFVENPNHKRSALVRLTQRGEIAIAEATRGEAELNTKVLPSFSRTELSSAAEVLNKLRQMLDGKETRENLTSKPEKGSRREQPDKTAGQRPEKSAGFIRKAEVSSTIKDVDVADGELPVNLL